MLLLPVAIVLLADVHARPRPDRGDGQHVLSRLRPSGLGVLAGVVFRDADPVSDRRSSRRPQWRLRLNPAFYFIELFHDVLYAGHWPRIGLVAAAALIAAASLGIGYAIFKSHEDKMVFRL